MGKKVLVMESDEVVSAQLVDGFEPLGWSVRVAPSGDSGREMAAMDLPDLLVLSAELPDADGFALCQELKQERGLARVPFVLVSDEATDEMFERHREMEGHAQAYLHKPFGFAELLVCAENLTSGLGETQELPLAAISEDEDDSPTQVGPMPAPVQATIQLAGALANDTTRPQPLRSEAPRPSSPSMVSGLRPPPPRMPSQLPAAETSKPERKKGAKPSSARKSRAKEVEPETPGEQDVEQLRAQVESLRADKAMAAKRADDFKARIAKYDAQIEKLEGQITVLRQSMAAAQAAHAEALKAEAAEGDRKVERARADFDKQTERLAQAHRENIASVDEAGRMMLADVQARHQAELEGETQARAELERKLAEQQRQALERAAGLHAEQVRELQGEIEQAKQAAKQAEAAHAVALERVEKAHQEAVARLLESHRAELDKAAATLGSERGVFEQKLAAAHAEGGRQWDDLEARMAETVKAHRGELDAMAARHAAATEALGEAHREQLALARRQLEEEREAHQAALQREQERHEQQLQRLEQGNALSLQEAARGPSETLARNAALQEQVGELLQQISRLEDKLRAADIVRQQAVVDEQAAQREEIGRREASHREAIARLEQGHREQLAAAETRHAEDLQRVEQEHAELMVRLEQAHREATTLVMQAHRAELDKTAEGVQRTKQLLEHAIAASAEETRKRATEFASQLETLHRAHRAALDELSSKHAEELESARRAASEELERAKQEHAAGLASARSDAEREKARHRDLVERMAREHVRALEQAASQPAQTLAKNLELERQVSSLQRHVGELAGQLQEAAALARRAEADVAAAQSRAELACDEEHRKAIEEMRAEHRAALAALESEAQAKLVEAQAEHGLALEAAEQQHRAELRAAEQSARQKLQEARLAHAAQLAGLEQEHRAQLAGEVDRLSARLEASEAAHAEQLRALREEHAAQLEQASRTPADVLPPQQPGPSEERAHHEAIVQKMLEAHRAELAAQKALQTGELSQAEQAHQQELQRVGDAYQEALRGLESRLAAELRQISQAHRQELVDVETRHQRELAALESQRAVATASTRSAIDAEVARALAERTAELESVHSEALAAAAAGQEARLQEFQARHEAALSALEQTHDADMRSREHELEAESAAAVRELEQKLVARELELRQEQQQHVEQRDLEFAASLQQLQDGIGQSVLVQERSFRDALEAERRVFEDKVARLEARLAKDKADSEASWAQERATLQRDVDWLTQQSSRLEASLRETNGLSESRVRLIEQLQSAYGQVQADLAKARSTMIAALSQMSQGAVATPIEEQPSQAAESVPSDRAEVG